MVVLWHCKLIPDLIGKEKVDRLPLLVSSKRVFQLLTVAKLPSRTRETQASAVFMAIEGWNITNSIRITYFDTTSPNTGRISGVLQGQKLSKELLYFACRHHVMELIIGAVFQLCTGLTFFFSLRNFKNNGASLTSMINESGMEGDTAGLVADVKESTIEFCNNNLQENKARHGYKKFLELVRGFLGAIPKRGVRFMSPGAMHHARWVFRGDLQIENLDIQRST